MARKSKSVSVYERIEEKENQIKETEELLAKLNEEVQVLYDERDDEEATLLFIRMKDNGLTIDKALELLLQNK